MARPNGGLSPHVVSAVALAREAMPTVVALGGGADSAVLLAAVVATAPDGVRGVFVDHGLESSAALADAASRVAEAVGVDFAVLPAPVKDGPDLEARAREARYAALEAVLAPGEIGMTGHTVDDQAETVLMRLAAGAGARGLSGIPARRGPWRRPLLAFSKAELRAQADTLELPYADDVANRDDRFVRSRIRHDVVPALDRAIGHPVSEAIARSAALLRLDDDLIDAAAHDVPIVRDGDRVLIPTAALLTADPPVASRVCRRALRSVFGGTPGSLRDVEGILAAAVTGATAQLGKGLLAVREGPHVSIGRRAEPPASIIVGPGDTFAWGNDRYAVVATPAPPPVQQGGRFTVLDAESVGSSLTMRHPRPGDLLDIEVGSTPIAELLRAHGIAAPARPVSLLVAVDAKIAAVAGVRTAAWAKPRRQMACVIIERVEGT